MSLATTKAKVQRHFYCGKQQHGEGLKDENVDANQGWLIEFRSKSDFIEYQGLKSSCQCWWNDLLAFLFSKMQKANVTNSSETRIHQIKYRGAAYKYPGVCFSWNYPWTRSRGSRDLHWSKFKTEVGWLKDWSKSRLNSKILSQNKQTKVKQSNISHTDLETILIQFFKHREAELVST